MPNWILESEYKENLKPKSKWVIAPELPASEKGPSYDETLTESLGMAVPRIGEDIYKGLFGLVNSIPGKYEASKTEIPGLINTIRNNPNQAYLQGAAGLAELGQNVFNAPHDLANYAANRLNLFPKDINEKIQMARMPDSSQQINAQFGEPQQAGDLLARGLGKNAINLTGAGAVAKALNPMQLTSKNIMGKITGEGEYQYSAHKKQYDKLWRDAEREGFNQVPYDPLKLIDNYLTIEKYTTPKQHQSLVDFANNPTLENAQRAQSDLGNLRRIIEEKSKTTPLLKEEGKLYASLKDAEKHIENNMFKNSKGDINKKFYNRYQKITDSYRENVVPYKYNDDINLYLDKKLLASEAANRLKRGEFAAKKGQQHPELFRADALKKLLKGFSLAGIGVGGAGAGYHYLSGKSE